MSKFATNTPPNVTAPVATTTTRMRTYTGGIGHERDAKSELFLLAVSNMVKEDTFHEDAAKRDARFENLIHQVTREDPEWVEKLVPYLRDTMHLRSASLVMAAEYAAAKGPSARRVISAALQRADEPAELLGYWFQTYGRKIPAAVKRGCADAVTRLYTERSALRNDGSGRPWRMGDVIDLVHPTPIGAWQSELFKHLLNARHGRDTEVPELLEVIAADRKLMALPEAHRRAALGGELWQKAGWSWERLAGWLPGGMDAEAWEAVIPQMGYMALLRNLRNFDQAKVSDEVAQAVGARLADPEAVAKSKQFPFRFLSAYREIGSLRWAWPLERALDLSLANVPSLPGRTLVMVDLSGSMWGGVSGRSKRQRWELALIFGAALAKRAASADLVCYGTHAVRVPFEAPLLKLLEAAGHSMGGTNTFQTLAAAYENHDRVIIITDEQAHDAGHYDLSRIPLLYTFNLGGYRPAQNESGAKGKYTFGGLTDAGFQLIPLIESQRGGVWPHLT